MLGALHAPAFESPSTSAPKVAAPKTTPAGADDWPVAEPGQRHVPVAVPTPREAERLLAKAPRDLAARLRARTHRTQPGRVETPLSSFSVGTVTTGSLVRGRPLPLRGPGWRVLEATARRDFVYGSETLVAAIERAAGAVAEQVPGSVLLVGNLSRKGGGDIPQSVSHNSGRDVDLAFYARTPDGKPVDDAGFVAFDPEGWAQVPGRGRIRFDAARNWALVAAFLSDATIQVQYIFVADWLRDILLDYAIRTHQDPVLIAMAEDVLHQPTEGAAHDDHFHLRIYCDRLDLLHGCHDVGVVHPWVVTWKDEIQRRIDALIDRWQHGDAATRAEVQRELDLLTVEPASEPDRGETLGP